ncbi:MAG: DUF3185 domain-containing protein [candidate division Zixibacteria bacterium]|nr:DUF3185 domain-containing protein [candidate division Zixibacteria bacterium]
MNTKKRAGIVLIIVGALLLAFQGVLFSDNETIADVPGGSIAVEEDRTSLPAIFGGLALVGGIIMLLVGSRTDDNTPVRVRRDDNIRTA